MREFLVKNIDEVDSPSLLLYASHLQYNIEQMMKMVDNDHQRLMPHIKTNKMVEVVKLMVEAGIYQFKTATIGECEIAARAGAKNVLLSHQLVGPKFKRFFRLISNYDESNFWTIVDNIESAKKLQDYAETETIKLSVFIDINNGMDRTGIKSGEKLNELVDFIYKCNNLIFLGLHVYDGHLRNPSLQSRKNAVKKDINEIEVLFDELKEEHPYLKFIVGGTPTFSVHSEYQSKICSPGTCVLWDWGYSEKLKEQKFKYACLLLTRVISKPTDGIITVDLGHKSVASENPIDKRIKFLNLEDYELISQSEEHGVIKVKDWEKYSVGDVLYGIPYHICPTVNLHDYVNVVIDGFAQDKWKIIRNR
ncbi:MAG: D-TA family PLP-dependent enzyme [Flavobacteriaceae bacterium]|nr:D-TA family PLP-dependent enzyme [Flavobacteriaceae bacterium]